MGQVVVAVIVGLIVGLGLMRIHRLLGPVAGTGLSVLLAPWLVPALITGGVTLSLLACDRGDQCRRGRDADGSGGV